MPAMVAWVSALIGLKVRLPQALSQISARISVSTRDFSPALTKASLIILARSVSRPSSSPTGKRSPSTCSIIPGAAKAAAG